MNSPVRFLERWTCLARSPLPLLAAGLRAAGCGGSDAVAGDPAGTLANPLLCFFFASLPFAFALALAGGAIVVAAASATPGIFLVRAALGLAAEDDAAAGDAPGVVFLRRRGAADAASPVSPGDAFAFPPPVASAAFFLLFLAPPPPPK